MAGIEIAIYIWDQLVEKSESAGSIIRPTDQNSSKITEVMIFARPFVISATKSGFCYNIINFYLLNNLRIICPEVYIKAHVIADRQRKITWST